jgi:ABC-type transport system involved in cytochrome bd biosynthesis fused ATPase/permease subunit
VNIELQLFLKNKFLELRHLLLTGLTGLVLILVFLNIVLYRDNVKRQQEISSRQALIQQTQQLEPAYNELVKGLAELAATRADKELRQLLANQGITATLNSPATKQDGSGDKQTVDAADGERKK